MARACGNKKERKAGAERSRKGEEEVGREGRVTLNIQFFLFFSGIPDLLNPSSRLCGPSA